MCAMTDDIPNRTSLPSWPDWKPSKPSYSYKNEHRGRASMETVAGAHIFNELILLAILLF